MILRELKINIYPLRSGETDHRIDIRLRTERGEFEKSEIVYEDHLVAMFDRIFDRAKAEIREALKRK